jgi:hypothetical protein
MIMHANHGDFRKEKSLVCAAGCTSSVAAVVGSSGEEWMATAPPDTATTSIAVAVRTAKSRSDCRRRHYVRMSPVGTAKMVVERQVHELGVCGFECVFFGGIPW